ncbi:sugar phosphate isomerase/epimerase [Leifsonia sp. fls2-241-R2A-40a]|uniref:sugar phosphate isomerase/epimerase family protein n=1 Tax=Leifsonia sp. fls2-241-R2A-40a TaxID=3040290 RepID=UPI00254D98FE|nr:sugar phosphate isomerase/epimerase [Leifsonia sp. fls2-241-R2A-40a]
MSLPRARFACQTYSWQMSADRFRGTTRHMAQVAADAGFAGFEPEVFMLGADWNARRLDADLASVPIQLAALCLVHDWRGPSESDEERREADAAIDAVAGHPGAVLNLVVMPGADREDLRERQRNALACMREVAQRAADRGVVATFHPNSPAGSVFRTPDDYELLLDELPEPLGFTPDVGHIAKGGMDPIALVRRTSDRIRHVHIKDIHSDGGWAATGEGVLDIPAIVATLDDVGYRGWIAFEDESPLAERDPDEAVRRTGAYVRRSLITVTEETP